LKRCPEFTRELCEGFSLGSKGSRPLKPRVVVVRDALASGEESSSSPSRPAGERERASVSWKSDKVQTVRRQQQQGPAEDQGCIAMLKDSYGFVTCVGREERLFFHFTMLQGCREGDLQEGAEVAFKTREDRVKNRLVAYAVRLLPPGTVQVGARVESLWN